MDFYAETTIYILVACVLASLALISLSYQWLTWLPGTGGKPRGQTILGLSVIPVLVVGPVVLLLGFGLLHMNFLYPVRLDSSAIEALNACFVPAMVLFVCSGLLVIGLRQVRSELLFWQSKAFVTVTQAMGLSANKALRRLVVMKACSETWAKCLPWVFGELIIVEVVFNAPGVGYALWNFAKMRQFADLWQPLVLLAGMYIVMALIVFQVNRWLGVKLATYA